MLNGLKMWVTRCILLLAVSLFLSPLKAETVIKVGGYEFPPFVNTKNKHQDHGAALDMIESFNKIQKEFVFEFYPTSSKRRYMDFSAGRYDIIMFENIDWGWKDHPVEQSKVFMTGGEVYIAYNRPERDQHFFDNMANKRMVGILGYHYGFANFNADEEYLSENFNVLLSTDHLRNIRLILTDRPELAEIAVVTRSFLGEYLGEHPEDENKLLISDKFDQEYQHRILVRKNGPISVERVNQLLSELEANGVMDRLKKRYGFEHSE